MLSLNKAKQNGQVDEEVIPYLDLINSVPDLATSSSCYGRIVLMDIPTGIKKDSTFLSKWHRKISFEEFWKALESAKGKMIWLKVEPLILHVSTRDISSAKELLKVKSASGIRRGGVFAISNDRWQVELEGTQRMETLVKTNEILITKDYGRLLVDISNKKMDKNTRLWERFKTEFKKEFIS